MTHFYRRLSHAAIGGTFFLLVGCASGPSLKPLTEETKKESGVRYAIAKDKNCEVKLSFLDIEIPEHFVFGLKVTNLGKKNITLDPQKVHVRGGVLGFSPVSAMAPQAYLEKLKDQQELYELRAKQNVYEGVPLIADVNASADPKESKRLKSEYANNQMDTQNSKKRAQALILIREKAAKNLLQVTTVKPQTEQGGEVVVPLVLRQAGTVTVFSEMAEGCHFEIPFEAGL